MEKEVIIVRKVPAIGPYSPAVVAGPFVFCSGQIPMHPETGEVVTGDIRAAAAVALENLGAVLAEVGLDFDDVVKTTIFLTDMGDFPAVNEVYARYFQGNYPARSTVAVAALPRGAAVEIEAIAIRS